MTCTSNTQPLQEAGVATLCNTIVAEKVHSRGGRGCLGRQASRVGWLAGCVPGGVAGRVRWLAWWSGWPGGITGMVGRVVRRGWIFGDVLE